jgi:hypothetical protein
MSDPAHRNLHVFVCTTVGRHHCGGQGSEHLLQRLRDEVERLELTWVRTTRMGCNQQHHQGPIMIVYPTVSGTAVFRSRMSTRSSASTSSPDAPSSACASFPTAPGRRPR